VTSQEIEFFLAVAEIAMAVVTFAALVLVLRQLVGGGLGSFHVLALKMFAVAGFETSSCALVPFVLDFAGVDRVSFWRISCGVLTVVMIATNIWYFRARRRAAPSRQNNSGVWVSLIAHLSAIGVMSAQVFALISADSPAPLAFGLITCLVPMAAGFLTTLQDFLEVDPA